LRDVKVLVAEAMISCTSGMLSKNQWRRFDPMPIAIGSMLRC
jgi:hypothetical protein